MSNVVQLFGVSRPRCARQEAEAAVRAQAQPTPIFDPTKMQIREIYKTIERLEAAVRAQGLPQPEGRRN